MTRDGRVKILDFGLAKLTHQEERRPGDQPADGLGRDGARRRDGDARLHVARAGQGQAGRRPVGHLLLRRHPLRDALGTESVPRRLGGRDDLGDPPGGAAGSLRHEPERLARPRADRAALPREESRAALPVGARPRLRPRGAVGAARERAPRASAVDTGRLARASEGPGSPASSRSRSRPGSSPAGWSGRGRRRLLPPSRGSPMAGGPSGPPDSLRTDR